MAEQQLISSWSELEADPELMDLLERLEVDVRWLGFNALHKPIYKSHSIPDLRRALQKLSVAKPMLGMSPREKSEFEDLKQSAPQLLERFAE